MKRAKILAFFSYLVVFSMLAPSLALAAPVFNPGLIITDQELTAADTMTAAEIQRFLITSQSPLANMQFVDVDGVQKSASEIIFEAARDAQINPRYVLVMIQKEQSLITSQNPTQKQLDWATGFGVCDSCSMSDPSIQKYRGFANQVRSSANVMRYYYTNQNQSWIKQQNATYAIDNLSVTPQSFATAFLYTYTPHISGNKNFWKIWTQWFTKVYPDGSLLQASGDKTIYLLQNGQLRQFMSMAALISRFNPNLILKVQPDDLLAYAQGPAISLPNYSLVRVPSGMIYLLIDDTKHPIASTAVFKTIGFNPSEVSDVADADLAAYQSSTFITTASVYPLGTIAQDKKSKALYYIKNGERSIIPSKEILTVNYPKKKIVVLDEKQLSKYPLTSDSITFKDGTLISIKGSPFTYVISNGTRRLIPSASAFHNLGYQEKNIIQISEQSLTSITPGPDLPDVTAPNTILASR